uniref:TMV resistance protein N-like n=1 Tax=Populus alba TaxID=43335 RepID=A0A4V6A1D8_POPAL|nr:hypothetical protein D5086_0000297780 [Populus alba]
MEGLSIHGWIIRSVLDYKSSNWKRSLVEALCSGGYGYRILFNRCYTFSHRDRFTMISNWFSYRGKGSSLSFHIPPVFQGLVVGVVYQRLIGLSCAAKLCIKNKSNDIQLFEAYVWVPVLTNLMRYISLSEMAMKEHCEDEELELCVGLYMGEDAGVFECGIHVIVEKTDLFEGSEWDHESEVGRDGGIPAPPYLSQYWLYNFIGIDDKQGGGHQEFKAILKNKRDGIPLFEATHARPYFRDRWLRLISRREMAMEKYCEDDELELHVILRSENSEVVRYGIHVILTSPFGPSTYDQIPALDPDHDIDYYETSFEGSGSSDHEIDNQESEVESDRTIPSPPYHLHHHPRHGSMRFSTM